ncbi:hypothetical protein N7488_001159 [Penicillium malachiteum]|nr:hypothetical protein N7488_001159 [Penicillium malachiteum]
MVEPMTLEEDTRFTSKHSKSTLSRTSLFNAYLVCSSVCAITGLIIGAVSLHKANQARAFQSSRFITDLVRTFNSTIYAIASNGVSNPACDEAPTELITGQTSILGQCVTVTASYTMRVTRLASNCVPIAYESANCTGTKREIGEITALACVVAAGAVMLGGDAGDLFESFKDSSCIGNLLVVLTDDFDALEDIGWYQTTYLLTLCAAILVMGRLYNLYSMKTLYALSFTVLVAGSILTAASPTSTSFILSRVVSGFGAPGINAGMYMIKFWTIVGLGSAVALGVTVSSGRLSQNADDKKLSVTQRLKDLDWYGLATQFPMTICLILCLQWAGTTYKWSNWKIIFLFALSRVLAILFFVAELIGVKTSMIFLPLLRQRNVAFSCVLPLYFQVVRGADTLGSGLMYLPTTLSMSICALVSGPFTSKLAYINPALLLGSALSLAGAALMTTFEPHTPAGRWIGYQISYDIGVGMALQPPFIAIQIVLEQSLVPAGLVLLNFVQMLDGIILLSISQYIFLDKLASILTKNFPNFGRGHCQAKWRNWTSGLGAP